MPEAIWPCDLFVTHATIETEKSDGIRTGLTVCLPKSIRNQFGQPIKARLLSVPETIAVNEDRRTFPPVVRHKQRGPCARNFRVRGSLFEHHGGAHFLDHPPRNSPIRGPFPSAARSRWVRWCITVATRRCHYS